MGVAIIEETDISGAPIAEKSIESSVSAVEWASIFGGALAAFGVTAILFALGPGLGLTTVSPWSFSKSLTDCIWNGGGNMVGRYPMALIRFWWLSDRAPSDEMGRHPH